jgi:3-hydroxyacyl-CoA dehydrogenase
MEINIVGCGAMASQIAALLYLSGSNVHVWNHNGVDESRINKAIKLIKRTMPLDDAAEGSIKIISKLFEFKNNITIEGVVEDLVVKKNIYKDVAELVSKPFFTNSSSINPLEIGEKVSGLHFFNPVSQIKLIELALNVDRDEEIELLLSGLNKLGFKIIDVKNNRGYIANYIIFNEISSVFKLIEIQGYQPKDINKIYSTLFSKNLFKMIDLIGVDVTYKILHNLREKDSGIYMPKILEEAINVGILGKKNGTSIMNLLEKNNG